MSTTTAAAIRDAVIARIVALTPSVELDAPFIKAAEQDTFRAWAERAKAGCLRRFSVRSTGAVMPPTVSNGTVERVEQDFEVVVAYPRTHRFRSRLGLDDVIESDLAQLEHTIGTNGFAVYATSVPAATITSPEPTRREEQFDGVVFGVLPLRASYWRAQP